MATNALIVLQGLATGSLLYVVFFEILEKERQKPVPGVLQVATSKFHHAVGKGQFGFIDILIFQSSWHY